MARGRLISKSLSTSKRFTRAGRADIGEFAQLVYVMLQPHADDFGRQEGDPFTIKARNLPTSRRTEEEFAAALAVLRDAGLIHWYGADDEQVIEIVGFDRHQPGLHKRTTSQFPSPPESSAAPENAAESPGISGKAPGDSGKVREIPPEEKRREENRTEQNRTEQKGREGKGASAPRPPRRPESIIGRGEAVRFAESQERFHARCHREVCSHWDQSVRVCMTATQVTQFAGKLLAVPEAGRVEAVIRWARSHVPTVAEVPANLFAYWDAQWDARAKTAARTDGIPTAKETRAMLREAEARVRR